MPTALKRSKQFHGGHTVPLMQFQDLYGYALVGRISLPF